jgi:lipopolysaccharide export system ATP-binding protein
MSEPSQAPGGGDAASQAASTPAMKAHAGVPPLRGRFAANGERNGKPILETEKLVKIYGGRAVVNGIDIELRPGEIVGLLGPNGAGKTTSFYMIVGLVRPNGGRVLFNGHDVTDHAMFKRARMGMGYLPQEESIFRKMTVRENIMAILETQPLSRKERKTRCEELLTQFGIEHVASQLALTLSGGEKRRLTIARSLVTKPSLLMLDEPFSGVDPIAVADVQQHIANLRDAGLGILITDHNVRETLSIVDRAYLIVDGKVVTQGSKDFLINDPVARRFYLGEGFQM